MLWIAALLSLIIWVIGRESGFLGSRVHLFLLLAILAVLAAFVPPPPSPEAMTEDGAGADAPDHAPNEGGAEHRSDYSPS